MANTIQIKRSTTTATPVSLAVGELAYSSNEGALGGSGNLFIGEAGSVITVIGGKNTAVQAAAALPSASFTDAAVTGKLITGYSSGAGTVAATDSILQAINKLNGNIAAVGGGTVTAVSVATANGVSGSSSGGATPALTISLGAITPSTVNGLTLAAQTAGFTLAGGTASKTMTFPNSLTISGTDTSTLAIGTGGTLGTAAYTAATAYATAAQGTLATNAFPNASFTDAAVTGKLITGFVSGAGTVAATDTILSAINKLDGNVAGKSPLAGSASLTTGSGGAFGTAAYTASTAYATSAQGTLATNALASSAFTDTAVTGKLITNYTGVAGTVAATDTILQAINKLNGNDTANLNTAKSYADGLVVGLWDDRGNFDASSNTWPSTGGSGTAGAILKGDIWMISVAGTLGGVPVATRQTIRATIDTPATTAANWAIALANTDIDDGITDGVTGRAPSQNAVFDALALKAPLLSPSFTTPTLGTATATKINLITITQPATGGTLTITEGATLTASATASVSGTNTGDNAVNSNYSGLVTNATHSGDVSGATTLTIGAGKVTTAMHASVPANTIAGNNTGSPAVPADLTTTQIRTMLNVADGATANAGTVTSVTAGAGLTQSGTASVNPTIDVVSASGTAGTVGTLTITTDAVGVSLGSTSTTACSGADSRLSDARTPTAHNQAWSTITSGVPTTLSGYGITDAMAAGVTIDGGTF